MDLVMAWGGFLVCLGVIAWAGSRLIALADDLAALSGLSRHWLGLSLLAVVTSLPELVAGSSAVLAAQAPGLAVGDVLGSCVLNLALLALVSMAGQVRRDPVSAQEFNPLAVWTACALLALVGVEILCLASVDGPLPWVGVSSLGILAVYPWVLWRSLGATSGPAAPRPAGRPSRDPGKVRRCLQAILACAVLIAVAGTCLPFFGLAVSRAMGWSQSFVGAMFIAAATSTPEAVTTWAAWRRGAMGLAWGNLLGSNLFDLLILALDDLLWWRGPILAEVSSSLAVTAWLAAVMSALLWWAVRPRRTSAADSRRGAGTANGAAVDWAPPAGKWIGPLLLGLWLLHLLYQGMHG